MTPINVFYLLYAAGGYLVGLASLVYLLGFIADVGVPRGISDGEAGGLFVSVLSNFCLVMAFGLHHSITARRSFKRWWTRFVPAPIERATYLYMSALMTGLLVWLWQPIPMVIW